MGDDIEHATASARRACVGFAVACLVCGGIVVAARVVPTSAWPAWIAVAVTGVVGGYAIIQAGRPIQKRTGFDTDFMVSRVWLIGGFGLLLPLMAPVLLVLGLWHLRKASIGGYHTIKEGGGGRFYPRVELAHGEAKPLGLAFLLLGTLWPAVVAGVLIVSTST